MSSKSTPRGIRNNNPLNIRKGNNWKGEKQPQTDGVFEQFLEMKWGVRAAFVLIRNYIRKYGLKTAPQIIRRWAPSSENDTKNYIKVVLLRSNLGENEVLNFYNQDQMLRLFKAMCFVENGLTISESVILEGYQLAMKG